MPAAFTTQISTKKFHFANFFQKKGSKQKIGYAEPEQIK
jgi:hypothetical protein